MRRLIARGFVLTVLVGCGSDDTPGVPSAGASTIGGSTPTGGTTTGGSSGSGMSSGGTTAGMSGGGTSIGGAATGGKAGSGGGATGGRAATGGGSGRGPMSGGTAGGSASGGTPTAPNGPVDTCRGDACPLGPCDNGRFFSDTRCSEVYSEPVDEDSTFCAAGADGGYCLNTITNAITNWAITCSGGEAMFSLCRGGCALTATVAQCN